MSTRVESDWGVIDVLAASALAKLTHGEQAVIWQEARRQIANRLEAVLLTGLSKARDAAERDAYQEAWEAAHATNEQVRTLLRDFQPPEP